MDDLDCKLGIGANLLAKSSHGVHDLQEHGRGAPGGLRRLHGRARWLRWIHSVSWDKRRRASSWGNSPSCQGNFRSGTNLWPRVGIPRRKEWHIAVGSKRKLFGCACINSNSNRIGQQRWLARVSHKDRSCSTLPSEIEARTDRACMLWT